MERSAESTRRVRRARHQPKRVIWLRLLCLFAGGMLVTVLLKSPSFAAFLEGESPLAEKQGIDAPFIDQRDKYPTGCESVTAVMALQYAGIDISVEEFIDQYLLQGNAPHYDQWGNYVGADPREAFLGSPYSEEGWGCYAPVIADAVEQVLQDRQVTDLQVKELEGTTLSTLYREYVENGTPVMLWATIDMEPPTPSTEYQLENTGEMFTWIFPLHCLLLVGEDSGSYYFNDPLAGKNVSYDKDQVETAYQGVGMQAVVLVRDGGEEAS